MRDDTPTGRRRRRQDRAQRTTFEKAANAVRTKNLSDLRARQQEARDAWARLHPGEGDAT